MSKSKQSMPLTNVKANVPKGTEGKDFTFEGQLHVGSAGEQAFLDKYPHPLTISVDLRWDFIRVTDGARVELKTDTYDPAKFPNFFFERFSDEVAETLGGPWRARKDRVPVFVYLFEKTGTYYEFTDLKGLCTHLDKGIAKGLYKEFRVKNKGRGGGWVTLGYAVPRESVKEFFVKGKLLDI